MSSLSEIYFKKETLDTLLKGVTAKGLNGIGITLSINDEAKVFRNGEKESRQNISAYVAQSKEEREAGKERYYVANGGVFWTNGLIVTAKDAPEIGTAGQAPAATSEASQAADDIVDDLPF